MRASVLRVALCDDDPSFRLLLRLLLGAEGDIEVVSESCDGRRCVEEIAQIRPDGVLLDLSMPTMNGFDVLRHLATVAPETKIIVVSSEPSERFEPAVGALGAVAFIDKADPDLRESLPRRIRAACATGA